MNQPCSFFIAQLVPQPIAGQHHKLILSRELVLRDLGLGCQSWLQICVPNRPAHQPHHNQQNYHTNALRMACCGLIEVDLLCCFGIMNDRNPKQQEAKRENSYVVCCYHTSCSLTPLCTTCMIASQCIHRSFFCCHLASQSWHSTCDLFQRMPLLRQLLSNIAYAVRTG